MNIFYLHNSPKKSAIFQCDKHCVSQIKEGVQMLSTALHVHGVSGIPVKPTHLNHPSTIWVRQSRDNYLWACEHLQEMLNEYTNRYGKIHAYQQHLNFFFANCGAIPAGKFTEPPQCMPDQYKCDGDSVSAYRKYYIGEKAEFAKWKQGNTPEWWPL